MLRFSLGDEDCGRRLARWMCSLRKYPITRFGFDTISILELKGSGFVQTDIGKQIDKSLKAAVANGHMIPKVAEATRRLISGSAPTAKYGSEQFRQRIRNNLTRKAVTTRSFTGRSICVRKSG